MKANTLYLSQMRAARRAAELLDRYLAIVKGVCIAQYIGIAYYIFMYA